MSNRQGFVVGIPLCDYVTVTSWAHDYDKLIGEALGYTKALRGIEWFDTKIMQYEGVTHNTGHGSVFVGRGMQKDRYHHMVRVSGSMADLLIEDILNASEDRKVTRVDYQITWPLPDWFSQWRFFNRMKKKGHTVGWRESRDRSTGTELSTVYIGSRTSSRFSRIYVKMDNLGEPYLRFELEMKGDRASVAAREQGKGEDRVEYMAGCLYERLHKYDDELLKAVFGAFLGNTKIAPKVKVVKGPDKTKNWLIGQVLPAFERYINEHDSDAEVVQMFREAIGRFDHWSLK